MTSPSQKWIVGHPPHSLDSCWVQVKPCIIERGQPDTAVLLAVSDGQNWCESSCWRGVAHYDEPIVDEIIAYIPYQVPDAPIWAR